MRSFLDEIAGRLTEIEADGLLRTLKTPGGVDFASNDYLGLSRHPLLRERLQQALARGPIFAPASRLLRGNLAEHEALEERLAAFKGTEAALLFPSGYQANLAVLTALIGPQDVAVSDERNHASIIDGLRLSGSRKLIYPHLDIREAERALRSNPKGVRAFLVTESLFSMDGDLAPLDRCADVADLCGAALIVDDAHATGMFGELRGSGLCEEHGVERRATAIVSTFGKALGLCGAFVAGSRVVIDYLINKARPFVFSTAMPPLLVAAIHAALDIAAADPWRRGQALQLARRLRSALEDRGIDSLTGAGPIVPIVLGENEHAMRVAEAVQARGFDVRAIRPPSVAPGTARLRISVHADHTEAEIDALAIAIAEATAGLAGRGAVSLVVIGTGTGVGKTVACAVLLARFGRRLRLGYWKPVATGAVEGRDADFVRRAAGRFAAILPEEYLFDPPVSPHLAARLAGTAIDPERLLEALVRHGLEDARRSLVIEGVGGLLVPLTERGYLLSNLLEDFHLPCLLVASSALGTINHTLLTLEAMRSRGLEIAGVVLSGPLHRENRNAIERFGCVEVTGEIPPIRPLGRAGVLRVARSFDRRGRLKKYLS